MIGNLGLHIQENANGTFTFVGRIPSVLCDVHKASRADVLGGRSYFGPGRELLTLKPRRYGNVQDALMDVEDTASVTGERIDLCNAPNCACRKYFTIAPIS